MERRTTSRARVSPTSAPRGPHFCSPHGWVPRGARNDKRPPRHRSDAAATFLLEDSPMSCAATLIRSLAVAATAVTLSLVCATAAADWKPTQPVEFIVTAGPGGGTDNFARTIQSI